MAIHLFQWLAINWMIFVQSLPWKSAWTSPFPSIKKKLLRSGSLLWGHPTLHTAGLPPQVCAAMSARSGSQYGGGIASGGTSAFFTSTITFTSKSRRHLKACSLGSWRWRSRRRHRRPRFCIDGMYCLYVPWTRIVGVSPGSICLEGPAPMWYGVTNSLSLHGKPRPSGLPSRMMMTGDWIQSPDSSPVLGCTKRNTASSAKQHRKAPSQQFSQRPVRNWSNWPASDCVTTCVQAMHLVVSKFTGTHKCMRIRFLKWIQGGPSSVRRIGIDEGGS